MRTCAESMRDTVDAEATGPVVIERQKAPLWLDFDHYRVFWWCVHLQASGERQRPDAVCRSVWPYLVVQFPYKLMRECDLLRIQEVGAHQGSHCAPVAALVDVISTSAVSVLGDPQQRVIVPDDDIGVSLGHVAPVTRLHNPPTLWPGPPSRTSTRSVLQSETEKRKQEADRIRQKYPDRIPCIVEKQDRSDITPIDKKKYLYPPLTKRPCRPDCRPVCLRTSTNKGHPQAHQARPRKSHFRLCQQPAAALLEPPEPGLPANTGLPRAQGRGRLSVHCILVGKHIWNINVPFISFKSTSTSSGWLVESLICHLPHLQLPKIESKSLNRPLISTRQSSKESRTPSSASSWRRCTLHTRHCSRPFVTACTRIHTSSFTSSSTICAQRVIITKSTVTRDWPLHSPAASALLSSIPQMPHFFSNSPLSASTKESASSIPKSTSLITMSLSAALICR